MDINDVTGEMVYYVSEIIREFLGHNFMPGLRALKTKKNC